jgi:hypothetical protein
MHNLMKENAKNKYLDVEIEADLDDITYDSWRTGVQSSSVSIIC